MSLFLKRLALAGVSGLLALVPTGFVAEHYLDSQAERERTLNPFRHNPVIKIQAEERVFWPDPELAHRLDPLTTNPDPHNILPSTFVGREKIKTLDEVVESVRGNDRPIVLNLGDSSTSGWDSDIVTYNRRLRYLATRSHAPNLRSPFFQYETYSDSLEDKGFNVINAGVPGYSSLQGAHYLRRVLGELSERGVKPDFVTIYFGNNDSAWIINKEDKYQVPAADYDLRLIGKAKELFSRTIFPWAITVPRVSVEDYQKNLTDMIETAREFGVKPILIRPLIPKYWHPGLRAKGQEEEVWRSMYLSEGHQAIDDLEEAIEIYVEADWQFPRAASRVHKEEIRRMFAQAQELDYMIPRAKQRHVQVLEEVAEETGTPLVDVQDQIPTDDRRYFVDYCHPIEPANRLIAEGITKFISSN